MTPTMKPAMPAKQPSTPAIVQPAQASMRRALGAALLAALLPAAPVTQAAQAAQAAQTAQTANAERERYARLPVCKLRPDGRALAVEPCRTAPTRRPLPRRPVPQQIDPVSPVVTPAPAPAPPVTLFELAPREGTPAGTGTGTAAGAIMPTPGVPVLPPRGTSAIPPPSPYVNHAPGAFAAPPPGVSQPMPATCGPAGCRDAAGTRYNGSGVLTSPTGRLCHSAGGVVTCM